MKTIIHAFAGVIALLTIILFWVSTLFSELFTAPETIASIKGTILNGMWVLIPAVVITGMSGMILGGKREDALAVGKMKRMPIIAATGVVILLPAAFFLEAKASGSEFDLWFYLVQALELIAGASNIRLMMMNIRDGLRMTGRISNRNNTDIDADDSAAIEVQENGALRLSGQPLVHDSEGKAFEIGKTVLLCRCGASKNKPYCDGSHNQINFNDQLSAGRSKDEIMLFKGRKISIHYNKLLCSHAGACAQLKDVFNPERSPWIEPDGAAVDNIMAVIKACPSGALHYSPPGGPAQHAMQKTESILIEENGPYHVSGIALHNAHSINGRCQEKYVLCRCGASKNKPYCDGSHVDIGWKA